MVKIAIDAMGGDHAPKAIVAGAIQAAKEYPDPNKEQPLCPYPKIATYVGGDKSKASSFECK